MPDTRCELIMLDRDTCGLPGEQCPYCSRPHYFCSQCFPEHNKIHKPKEKKMELITIQYEGETTQVEIKPCSHCGTIPTAEDAEKAVKRDVDRAKTCAICGVKFKGLYPKHTLYHSVDCDGRGGFILCGTGEPVDPTWHQDWVSVSTWIPNAQVEGVFHISCLKKVAPGVTITPRHR